MLERFILYLYVAAIAETIAIFDVDSRIFIIGYIIFIYIFKLMKQ